MPPTFVSGGSGAVSTIQADDGVTYSVAQGGTMSAGGFPAVGGDVTSVVLHVKFSVDSGNYTGTQPIRVNGINTPIIPAIGDTQRTASIDITSGSFRVNTWPEITALAVAFTNNDSNSGQSVHFDHIYLTITHSTPLFSPPTWSDEFDDSGPPNPAVWTFEQGFVRNQELQWYQSNNAWQQGGNLIIEGRREQVPNPNFVAGSTDWRKNRQFAEYTSSSIKSQGKYSFKYGRMQVRAKIPCFPGTWPAIWTLGNSGEWPSNGECDVLEYYATDSVLANLARGTNTRWGAAWDAVKKPVSTFTGVNPNWRTEYHVWTMQWDEQNIRLYIDNHLMNTTAQSWLVNPVTTWGPKEPFKQPHFLLLNLALGGAGGNPSGTAFPLRYELDYVRVWEGLTGNNSPTDIGLSVNTIPEGLPGGTEVGSLTATDVDAAEVHSFSLVAGAGDTHNSSFEVVFKSDQTQTSVLRTTAVLNSADGATRSIRVRVTDIEGATFDKILSVQLAGQFVIEVSPATLTVPEGGNNTFNVRLRVPPAQAVTVNVSRLSGDADLNVATGGQLAFTPANGTAWQSVTLSAAEDDDRTNATATFHCTDASGVFSTATVVANEAENEAPPIPTTIEIGNLNQVYNGATKFVTVTTTPLGVSYDLTYNGQFMAPTDAGSHEVIATVTSPDHVGTATASLVIAKASQTINFGPLGPMPDDALPVSLTATSSWGLPIHYTSTNTAVAAVSENTLTIVGPGTTTITATQPGDDNRNAATPVPQTLTVFRANPLAVAGGPYLVPFNQALSLNGGASQASDGQTIVDYAWDLNNDGSFGDVTGAMPAAISFANLTTTWGMVDGPNTIGLRVTDSSGKTSSVSATVEIVVSLTWDSNASSTLQTDGSGDWTAPNQWWNGTSNATWVSGDDAIFGNSGAGGNVTLASPTTVNTLTFNSFTGTYTLGTASRSITLNQGITKNAGSGHAAIISPVTLAAAQTWTNHSSGSLTVGPDALDTDGFLLTVGGTGNTAISGPLGGAGGLTKTDGSTLSLDNSNTYSGATTVSGGTLILSNANTISATTSVAATGTLQLGHVTSLGTSTMNLASGATLQLRNDVNTTFSAPINNPTGAVTYHFNVDNATSAATGKTLSLGNLTFATSTTGSVTNRINITGGNGYTLKMGTLSAPSGGGAAHPVIIHPTTAAVLIARVTSGSFGTALNFTGSNSAALEDFVLGSNGNHSIIVNGAHVTLGTTTAANNRNSATATAAFTLASGTLNLTSASSISNLKATGSSGTIVAPTFTITGGTLNNTSGSALTLGSATGAHFNNNPAITLGGNFAFGTVSSTSANNLNLGTGALTNANNRTLTLSGTGTTLTLGGTMTNSLSGTQTTTVNGPGNTLSLGGYNLSNSSAARTGIFAGSANVTITGVVANSSNGSPSSSLTYNGSGTLTLGGQNTYTGNTTVGSGTLAISQTGGIYSTGYTATPTVTVSNGATLQLAAWLYGLNGGLKNLDISASRLLVNGGTIQYIGTGEGEGNPNNGRLFTIGTGGATLDAAGSGTWFVGPNESYDSTNGQIIPAGLTLTLAGASDGQYTKRLSGAGSLTKSGAGTWTLGGANAYSGPTAINGGTLVITGATQNTSAVTFAANSSLGLVIGAPVNAASAVVNFTNGRVSVLGTPNAPSHILLTALSFTGTPVLASPVPGYELQTVGNQLVLTSAALVDNTSPTLAGSNIVDDRGGSPVIKGTSVSYTISFNEDIDHTTVTASDFGNAGTSSIRIDAITEISPGVFTVQATPSMTGSLQIRVNAGATITDVANNPLDTASAISDDTVITVNPLMTTVPDVLEIAQSTAESAITGANLVVGTVTLRPDSSVPAGSVISQNPGAGTSIEENSPVNLVISLGPQLLNVSFDANGGDSASPTNKQVAFGSTYGALASANRAGHTFTGWFDAPSGGIQITPATVVTTTANHTLYAHWNTLPTVNAGPDQSIASSAPASWTPAMVSTLTTAWYDAADPVSVTHVGGAVSQWSDKSGKSRHATQAGALNQPTLRTSDPLVNNLPSIGSISLNGKIGLDTPSMPARNVYVVTYYKDGVDSTFDGYSTLFSGPGTNGSYRVMGDVNSATLFASGHFNDAGTYANGSTISSTTVLPMAAAIFKFKATAARTQAFSLGFNSGFTDRGWQGSYSEWIFTDGSEDPVTEQKIEGYLAHKWGLSARLPAEHPHKAATPAADVAIATLDATVTDAESDPLTYAWTMVSGPASVAFSNPAAADTTATFTAEGVYTLRLTTGDGFGSNSDECVITIRPPNTAPLWNSNPFSTAAATGGVAYAATLAGLATDIDANTLTYNKVSGPTWLDVATDGTLSGTPTNGDVGDNSFTVSVSDDITPAVQGTLTISVAAGLPDFTGFISNPAFGLAAADQDFNDDPDGDNLANGLEAWFGSHPGEFNGGLSGLVTNQIVSTFTHPYNENAPVDLSGDYQWSPNLVDWYAGDGVAGPPGGPTVVITSVSLGATTTVTATASAAMEQIFLRAKALRN